MYMKKLILLIAMIIAGYPFVQAQKDINGKATCINGVAPCFKLEDTQQLTEVLVTRQFSVAEYYRFAPIYSSLAGGIRFESPVFRVGYLILGFYSVASLSKIHD